ncbi:odorant receptor 24a isoform X8 [Ooceraea biroi]|uniref:odorant receptor 24a isoform X8 n=1 Tax=Ooceraea biroi TaxID=2015173 RepID=UPI0005BB91B6|nr:odorant receptor 24a isoform X8 [Ooceraea biroi]
MICIVEHFRIQRILLFAIGVWPYNQSKCVQFQYLLLSVVLNSFVIFQLTPFINSELTVDLIIKLLSTIFFSLLCLIHQVSFWINIDVVKGFVERLQDVCNDLKDEKEIAIIKKYANSAEYISILVILLAVCCAFIITLMPIYPRILSTVLLVNISRPLYNMQFVTEYFIDKEKNFYLILLHTYAFLYIAIIVLVGGGLMGCAYLKHVCGLFSIASYRIEQSMIANIHEKTDQWNKMKKKIRLAVDAHRTAIECVSITHVCQTVLRDKVEEFLLHLILAISMLVYSFLANSCGEEITEHYNNMFSSAYSIEWYRAPIRVQKLILFLLQRSCKMHGIKIGGLFTASLEGFASLSTASVSYFTVIYSMQN